MTQKESEIEQDLIDIELSNNFNSNLKIMRNKRELSQNKLGDLTNISGPAIAMYEKNRFPSIEKLTKLSNSLNISIHALATGEKLIFNFTDGHFGRSMLLADRLLPLDEHKILITLMEAIIKNN
ncbi:MAG: helix-turn-helix transcriptional regulator [Exilibacterium sp.]